MYVPLKNFKKGNFKYRGLQYFRTRGPWQNVV